MASLSLVAQTRVGPRPEVQHKLFAYGGQSRTTRRPSVVRALASPTGALHRTKWPSPLLLRSRPQPKTRITAPARRRDAFVCRSSQYPPVPGSGTPPPAHDNSPSFTWWGSRRKHQGHGGNPLGNVGHVTLGVSWGVAALLLANAAVFAAAVFLRSQHAAALAIYDIPLTQTVAAVARTSRSPWTSVPWQRLLSSAFVHANSRHLARNLFFLWLFGGILQGGLSGFGVWFTYLICAVGANLSALKWLSTSAPATSAALYGTRMLGVGATGGCTGVILTTLILSMDPLNPRWILSALVAGHFALSSILRAPVPLAGGIVPSTFSALSPYGSSAADAAKSAVAQLVRLILSGAPKGSDGIFSTAAAAQSAATAVLSDSALVWLPGVILGTAIVVILARLPAGGEPPAEQHKP